MSLNWTNSMVKEEMAIVPNCLEEDLDPILLEDSFIGVSVPVNNKPPDAVFVDPNYASQYSQSSFFMPQQQSGDGPYECQFADTSVNVDVDLESSWSRSSGDTLNGWLESTDLSEFLGNLIGEEESESVEPNEELMPPDDEEQEKIMEILNELYQDSNQIEAEMSDHKGSWCNSESLSPMSTSMESQTSSGYPSPTPSPYFKSPQSKKIRSRVEKKERKKQQNREAATRYRMKKRLESHSTKGEIGILLSRNKELKGQVEDAEYQIKLIKGLISEVRSKRQALLAH